MRTPCLGDGYRPFSEFVSVVADYFVFEKSRLNNDEIKQALERAANKAARHVAFDIGGYEHTVYLDIQSGVCHYHVPDPVCHVVHAMECVDNCLGAWRDECTYPGRQFYRYLHKERTILLGDTPCQDVRGGLRLDMRIKPTMRACGMPPDCFDDVAELIESKMIEQLSAQGARQWHSTRKSLTDRESYTDLLNHWLVNNNYLNRMHGKQMVVHDDYEFF